MDASKNYLIRDGWDIGRVDKEDGEITARKTIKASTLAGTGRKVKMIPKTAFYIMNIKLIPVKEGTVISVYISATDMVWDDTSVVFNNFS